MGPKQEQAFEHAKQTVCGLRALAGHNRPYGTTNDSCWDVHPLGFVAGMRRTEGASGFWNSYLFSAREA